MLPIEVYGGNVCSFHYMYFFAKKNTRIEIKILWNQAIPINVAQSCTSVSRTTGVALWDYHSSFFCK